MRAPGAPFMSPRGRERGYALYEVIIALALMGLVSLAVFAAFKAGDTAWTTSEQFVSEQQNARTMLNTISRAVRMVGYQYTGGNPPIIDGQSSSLAFYADMDGDGTIECYRYYLSGTTVYEAVVQGASCASSILTAQGTPLSASMEAQSLAVNNLTFTYYSAADLGGASLSTPLSTGNAYLARRIDVSVTVRGVRSAGPPFTIDTQAVFRVGR
jgi:Tfp pilus assembly protein PilW